ncbi:hypothetical protein [Streptomyces sp. NPDC059071]|uniref:hypothetical protein n=1 Tax=Streptomyces sp. NPDC059071 TaxID=3346714 RepID=UPI00369F8E23
MPPSPFCCGLSAHLRPREGPVGESKNSFTYAAIVGGDAADKEVQPVELPATPLDLHEAHPEARGLN